MSTQIEITKNLVKYLSQNGYRDDPIIEELIKETKETGKLYQMQIAPEQGQFLEIIAKLIKAKKCLEIGRFTGLSTLCLARGTSEDGTVFTVDNSEEFLKIAEKYWNKANVNKKIKSFIGTGINILNKLNLEKEYFDLIFIDADKKNYDDYYELSLNILKSNGLLIIDNVLWKGNVADKNNIDETTIIMRLLTKKIKEDNRVEFTLLPLADGVLFVRKK